MSIPNVAGISEGLAQSIEKTLGREETPEKPMASIAVSISESEDAASLGFTQWHLQDALIEVSRYLLVHNCRLLYGGDLRKGGFTNIFSELINQYTSVDTGGEFRAVNYFAWPIHLQLNRTDESEFKASGFEIKKLSPPEGLGIDAKTFIEPNTIANKIIWFKSLSVMRQQLSENAKATIVIGGRVTNYMSKLPGVLEEVLVNINNQKPLYLAGAFGGVTKAVTEVLQYGQSNVLTEVYQLQNASYKELYLNWNNNEEGKIDYEDYVARIRTFGTEGLSKTNGLSKAENLRLFQTPHIPEVTYLILKGLTTIGLI